MGHNRTYVIGTSGKTISPGAIPKLALKRHRLLDLPTFFTRPVARVTCAS
jgi:hypothetical protein